MNTAIKTKTYESALDTFISKHAGSEIEYGAQIDAQGFVSSYNKGNAGSVDITNRNPSRREVLRNGIKPNSMLVHNHPGGSHFSLQDLDVTSRTPNSRGIVAVGTRNGSTRTFSISKGTHFNAIGFSKAIRTATLRGLDYDHALDNWLTANQKRYGYRYTSKGYVNPSRSRKA